jgi:hypothetical protein
MSPVIVAGVLGYCGVSKLTGMLHAGGIPLAGGAHEPTFEAPKVIPPAAVDHADFNTGMFRPFDPKLQRPIDLAWWSNQSGRVVKFPWAHLMLIPRGKYRALWCDPVDERHRAILWAKFTSSARVPSQQRVDLLNHYFVSRRVLARQALAQAGAKILTVNQIETTSGAARCRSACERIAGFLEVPLNIDAMVDHAAAVPTGPISQGVMLDGPDAIDKARAMLDAQPPGTHVLFLPPR